MLLSKQAHLVHILTTYHVFKPLQVMARTNKGQTPLHIAVEMAESQWLNREYNYGLTIKLLLGAGALINTADSIANTPLHVSQTLVKPWSNIGQTCACVRQHSMLHSSYSSPCKHANCTTQMHF
jgi:ankyrin repeat protein